MHTKHHAGHEGRATAAFRKALVFCAACIAINTVGSLIADTLHLPIYLDSMGTILAAIIGGFVPGIVVGYATNLLNGIFESTTIYYGIINVVIAMLTTLFAQRDWFRRLSGTLCAALLLGLASGSLGTLVSFLLNGEVLYEGAAAPFATQLYVLGVLDLAPAQVAGELFVNIVDKTLVVLGATLSYHLMPESLFASLDFIPWQQVPLSKQELADTMSERPRAMSLGTKVVALVAAIIAVVALATTAFSQITHHRSMIQEEAITAQGITTLMEAVVDPDKVPEYLAKGEDAEGY